MLGSWKLRSVVGAWGLKAQGLPKQAAFLQISCDQVQIFELPGGNVGYPALGLGSQT